jgi:chromate transporter
VGIAVGILRARLLGGLASWLGFTLPSALALVAFAYGLQTLGGAGAGWLHGLKVVAVAVVAQAVWEMVQTLTPDRQCVTLAVLAAIAMLAWPTAIGQVLIIAAAGCLYHGLSVIGWHGSSASPGQTPAQLHMPISHRLATVAWALFLRLLLGLPLLRHLVPSQSFIVFDSFFPRSVSPPRGRRVWRTSWPRPGWYSSRSYPRPRRACACCCGGGCAPLARRPPAEALGAATDPGA